LYNYARPTVRWEADALRTLTADDDPALSNVRQLNKVSEGDFNFEHSSLGGELRGRRIEPCCGLVSQDGALWLLSRLALPPAPTTGDEPRVPR